MSPGDVSSSLGQGGIRNKKYDMGSDFFFSGSRAGLTNWGGNNILYIVILYNLHMIKSLLELGKGL